MTRRNLLGIAVGAVEVGGYPDGAHLDATLAPRPYLHPLATLGGTVVTDALPADHAWHLGVSVAVQDVNSTNLWGGRTYVRDQGYTWLEDHGRIVHDRWTRRSTDHADHELTWLGRDGAALLTEHRHLTFTQVGPGAHGTAWRLGFAFTLTNPTDARVELGSPGTNGRVGGGYGGFFWRVAPSEDIEIETPDGFGEERAHGRAADWLAWRATSGGQPYTLIFLGHDRSRYDPWFVRAAGYPGVGSAMAFDRPVVLAPGATTSRHVSVVVADGRWPTEAVAAATAREEGAHDHADGRP